jgi:hypothetical protein
MISKLESYLRLLKMKNVLLWPLLALSNTSSFVNSRKQFISSELEYSKIHNIFLCATLKLQLFYSNILEAKNLMGLSGTLVNQM